MNSVNKMSLRLPFSAAEQIVEVPEHQTNAELLTVNFSMNDLNDVHSLLWIVGSRGNVSPLHHQRVLLRQIIPSESPRLHLVWFDRIIYVKPLHDYLLNVKCFEDIICKDPNLHALVLGFLISYTRLIQTPLDLAVAHDLRLVPTPVTWKTWDVFRQKILLTSQSFHVDKRYVYGELRLARLDLIWRCSGRGSAYFTVHREYRTYFDRYFALFITVFAFVTTILGAMQIVVGISTSPEELLTVCYRFSIIVLVGICACFLYVGIIFLVMFLYNTTVAVLGKKKIKSV